MNDSKDAIKKNSKCFFLTQNCWESMEKQLNSIGIFSQDFTIADSSRDPAWFERGTLNPKRFTDRIIFMSMFNDIDWTRKGNQGVRENSPKDIGRSGMELFFIHLKDMGCCSHSNGGTVQRCQSSSTQDQVLWVVGSWKREFEQLLNVDFVPTNTHSF